MKTKYLTVCAFVICAVLLVSGLIFTRTSKPADIDELLTPYRAALDRINAEIGSQLVISEGAENSVYDAYKDYTPEEFEELVKQEYLDGLASATDTQIDYMVVSGKDTIPVEIP